MREILIRLEDELYEQCKNTKLTEENEGFDFHIIKSVANGTVLPKGHGDIVDIETLIDMFWDGNSMEITKYDLSVIEPIIETDKVKSEV